MFPVAMPGFAPEASLRPVARPFAQRTASVTAVVPSRGAGASMAGGGGEMIRQVSTRGQATAPRPTPSTPRSAALCGDGDIRGAKVGPVTAKVRGCGIDDGVKVHSVSGVLLSRPALMDCRTAKTLKHWIEAGLDPAVGRRGGGVAGLRVAADYSCRTRNHKKGARISEHGKGRAIDISGIQLRDGTEISVLDDWGRGRKGRILQKVHRAACGPFGTVLGPNSDRHHRDHFHFDTARYRSGAYCR